jgi:toxin-antitoxin system PIN domain toxin
VKLVDANVLLYAVNQDAPHHRPARAWLDRALSSAETVGFSWVVLLAFLRLATRPALFPQPLTQDQAAAVVGLWLDQPPAVVVQPGERHLGLLRKLLESVGTAGNLVNDAHLAALALEHRADIVSFDRDFERFEGVRVTAPRGP